MSLPSTHEAGQAPLQSLPAVQHTLQNELDRIVGTEIHPDRMLMSLLKPSSARDCGVGSFQEKRPVVLNMWKKDQDDKGMTSKRAGRGVHTKGGHN